MRAAWRMETAPRSKNREKRHASALLSNNGLRAEGGGVPIDVSRAGPAAIIRPPRAPPAGDEITGQRPDVGETQIWGRS
jgi:hypothetical protein